MPHSAPCRSHAPRPIPRLGDLLLALAPTLAAQIPSGQNLPSQLPSPQQAQDLLRNQPALVEQLRQRIGAIRTDARPGPRAAPRGWVPRGMLDDYLEGADTTKPALFGPRTLDAVRALGVVSAEEADSLARGDSLLARERLPSGAARFSPAPTGRFDPHRFSRRFTQGDDAERAQGLRSGDLQTNDHQVSAEHVGPCR